MASPCAPCPFLPTRSISDCDTHCFRVKLTELDGDTSEKDKLLSARMYKAITVILFKLEGQLLQRRPEFGMADRLLLDQIDYDAKTVCIGGVTYPLEDCDFPTVDPAQPYQLTAEEDAGHQPAHRRRSDAVKSYSGISASCTPRAGCIRSTTAISYSTAASP